jgi:hypothetical protein
MALTITKDTHPTEGSDRIPTGNGYKVTGSITFDDSYPTGGEVIDATDFELGIGESEIVDLDTRPPADGANFSTYDKANGKVVLFTADGTEAADTSDQSAVVHRFEALII